MPEREDILREATALVERVELEIPGFAEPIACGFRRDGSVSLFFGADPVFQFNTACELRRAFVGGRIHKVERGRLIAFTKERTAREVALIRHELTDDEAYTLLTTMQSHLCHLREALAGNHYTVVGQVPSEADICVRVSRWLKALPERIGIAQQSNVR
jgi:hypothetical protein